MCVRRFCILTLSVIFLIVKDSDAESQNHDLHHLLSNMKPPYIAVFYPNGRNIKENKDLTTEVDVSNDITPDIDSLDPPYDQKAYLLYHALRTTEDLEQIDAETAKHFETTKDILRQALRKRCYKLNLCFEECPKRFKIRCTVECKENYDDYNVCQKKEKKDCQPPRRGRTMPPKWLLRQ